jgi:hypothetical protein
VPGAVIPLPAGSTSHMASQLVVNTAEATASGSRQLRGAAQARKTVRIERHRISCEPRMERATYRPAAGMRRFGYSRRVLLTDEPFAAVDAQTLGQRVLILSSSPTVVRDDLAIDLPDKRDQLTTRSSPRFAELRARVYERCTARRRRRSSRSPAERSADPNGSEHPAAGPQLRALRPAGALSPTSMTSGAFRVGAVLKRCRRQNCPRGQSRKSVAPQDARPLWRIVDRDPPFRDPTKAPKVRSKG